MHSITISTSKKRQVIPITDEIARHIPEQGSGMITVFVQHTTAAITTLDLDPGTDLDFLDFLAAITPEVDWRHPHDPSHTPDHMLAGLIGPNVSIPYENGKLLLGTWQEIILVELDGARERSIIIV